MPTDQSAVRGMCLQLLWQRQLVGQEETEWPVEEADSQCLPRAPCRLSQTVPKITILCLASVAQSRSCFSIHFGWPLT